MLKFTENTLDSPIQRLSNFFSNWQSVKGQKLIGVHNHMAVINCVSRVCICAKTGASAVSRCVLNLKTRTKRLRLSKNHSVHLSLFCLPSIQKPTVQQQRENKHYLFNKYTHIHRHTHMPSAPNILTSTFVGDALSRTDKNFKRT